MRAVISGDRQTVWDLDEYDALWGRHVQLGLPPFTDTSTET